MTDWIQELNTPGREFSAMPFWFLNADLDHTEIRRQLNDFASHGIYGVVLHPRIGMRDDLVYLSEAFFSYIRTAVEEADRLGMKVILYDEGMYPSGSASGQVVEGHPELASRGIALTQTLQPDDHLLCRTEQGMLVERFSHGTIRGIHFGEDDGEAKAPLSADILNPVAVSRFIMLTHEAYWRHLSPYFGNTVCGFFTDEPSILGRNTRDMQPWTYGFAELFVKSGGHLEGLTGLFDGHENADTRLYHSLILERESEVYYRTLSDWCADHGIALMGHPHQSDDIEVERFFHVPGQDLVFRWVSPERGDTAGVDSTMGKCSADAARLMGRRRNSNECFGACNRDGNPWYFTGGDMKWMIDYLTVRGVNLLIPHAFYYSLEGSRSAERPPDVGPGSIWWEHYKVWAQYMARVCFLMTDAVFRPKIAVLCRNRKLVPEIVEPLFRTQRGFQYLPESVWKECRTEHGKLECRGMTFDAVLGDAALFPEVGHAADRVSPDCTCLPPQPSMRVAAFEHAGRACWYLVNSGEETIDCDVVLPTTASVSGYDLWRGEPIGLVVGKKENSTCVHVCLDRRESLLIYACMEGECAVTSARTRQTVTGIEWSLVSEEPEHFRKTYTANWGGQADADEIELTVAGEEMAEIWVNGTFCDVSFWNPHRLHIPAECLRPGENRLELRMTGSPANRYGTQKVQYGLTHMHS